MFVHTNENDSDEIPIIKMNQLKVGTILNYVVIILNALVGLLFTPYMLRMMGQSEYGLYTLVASIIAYLTVLDLGLGNAVIRYTAKFRAEEKEREQYEMFGMFLVLYLIIGFVAFIIGLTLYYNIDSMFGETMTDIELSRARIMMLILLVNLVVTFPMSVFGGIITAYEHFVFPKIVNICRVFLNTILMVVLLEYGFKAIAMVVLLTIFNMATLFVNYVYCRHKLKIKIIWGVFNWEFLKDVVIYSFWIFLNVLIDKIYWNTGQFVLGSVSGTIAVSVFAVAIHFATMYMSFSTAISSVFLPKVTGLVSKKTSFNEISDLFIRIGRIQNVIMSLLLFGFMVFGKQFIILWAGVEYVEAYYMVIVFLIALYIPLIQNIGLIILQARNQMKFRSMLYIVIAFLALFTEVVFSKLWGGLGCAFAVGALLLVQGLIMNIYYKVKQNIDIPRFWKEILKMDLVPVALSVLALYVIQNIIHIDSWYSFSFVITGYVVLYVVCTIVFSLNDYEKKLFLTPILNKLKK